MASRLGRLASETAVYGLSSIVGRLINFLLVPFYSHVFLPEAYEIVGLVYTAFVFLNIVYTYGMESAYLKFASGEDGRARVKSVFTTTMGMLALTGVMFSGLVYLFPAPLAYLIRAEGIPIVVMQWVALILVLDALTVVPFAELRLARRPWVFALLKLGNIGVNVGANLLLILEMGWGIEAVFVANVLASGLTLLALLPFTLPLFARTWDRGLVRELLRFGLPFVPAGLGYALTERFSLFVLDRTRPATETLPAEAVVGVFAVGWKLGVFMMLVVQMFRFAWQPFFLQHAKDADAPQLFARALLVLTGGMLAVWIVLSLFVDQLILLPLPGGRTLLGEAYIAGLTIVPLALLAYVFQGVYYGMSAGLYLTKRTRYFMHCTFIGSGVGVVAALVLVPSYGMVGAAWANVLAYAAMALSVSVFAQRAYPIPLQGKTMGYMAGWSAVVLGAWAAFPALQTGWGEVACALVGLAGVGGALFKAVRRRK